jgi:hypothetical protein
MSFDLFPIFVVLIVNYLKLEYKNVTLSSIYKHEFKIINLSINLTISGREKIKWE